MDKGELEYGRGMHRNAFFGWTSAAMLGSIAHFWIGVGVSATIAILHGIDYVMRYR